MVNVEIKWNNFFGIRIDDLPGLGKSLTQQGWSNNNPFINYSDTHSAGSYNLNIVDDLLRSEKHGFSSPYQILFDYRGLSSFGSWGKVIVNGEYSFPLELSAHKKRAIEIFERKGWLKKKNNPAPRVKAFTQIDGLPQITIEQACYYDQVGSNLTIDMRLSEPIIIGTKKIETLRHWDMAQANLTHQLPDFELSKFANTIGVAIALTTTDSVGKKRLIKRYRGKKVAVYRDMWHLPFSFALYFDKEANNKSELDVNELIRFDLPHEFAEEMGLELNDFGPIKPIAFCRDLARGGKPQFFLEMESKLSFKELSNKAHDKTGEYKGKCQLFDHPPTQQISPELAAAIILLDDASV